ncbi:hypothetical protein evm_014973 [Chilo suppressalis]|nr:hypothetical protein evm_014973 [Chilo suppressalis]
MGIVPFACPEKVERGEWENVIVAIANWCHHHHRHQPINVPTAGAQAFPVDGIGRLGHDPPRGPSADYAQQSTPTTNSQPEPKPGPSAPKQEQSVPKPKPAETITDVKPSKPQDVATKSNTEENKVKNIPNGIKGPASLNDVTPCKKIIPKNYLLDLLSVGDTILLSVDANASECRSTAPGFVCLSMHERFQTEYQNLCEVYVVDCENEKGDYKTSLADEKNGRKKLITI